MSVEVRTSSEAQTLAWASEFAQQLRVGDLIGLHGDLGAGKTVLARGICKSLGFTGHVHSPSYALVHPYPNQPPILHMDLYRLQEGADFQELGLDYELLAQSITLVEWPERLGNFPLPFRFHVGIRAQSAKGRSIKVW